MRVVGGHDYYDSGLAYGQDTSVVFLRNGDRRLTEEEVYSGLRLPRIACSGHLKSADSFFANTGRLLPEHAFSDVLFNRVRHHFEVAHVVLCGRLYNGLHILSSATGGPPQQVDNRWIWGAESLANFARDHDLSLVEGRSGVVQTWAWEDKVQRLMDEEVQTIEQWFTPQPLPDLARARIVDERITVLSLNPIDSIPRDGDRVPRPWRVNQPSLAQMQFAKAVDPYTAYQEISMWIAGVLPQLEPDAVQVTDNKVKIHKHGFDPTTSFRRPPSRSR